MRPHAIIINKLFSNSPFQKLKNDELFNENCLFATRPGGFKNLIFKGLQQ